MKNLFCILMTSVLFVGPWASAQTPDGEPEAVAVPIEAPAATVAESEIPLNLEVAKKSATSDNLASKVVYSLGLLLLLAGGLFLLVKKFSVPKNAGAPTQIKLVSQHHFGPKRSLALIRVAGESMLIGVTDQQINLVKSLSLLDEDVPDEVPQNFSKTLKTKTEVTNADEEDFAISGIKDVVQRKLRGMRNFQ